MTFNLLLSSLDYTQLLEETLNSESFVIFNFVFDVVVWLVGYLFLAFALLTLAKRQNFNKKWLAFIPFFNFILLGKIIGKAIVWGKEIKNIGLFTAILGLATAVLSKVLYFYETISVFESVFNVTVQINNQFLYDWIYGESLAWDIAFWISTVLDLGYLFFEISMIFLVFRLYCPERAFIYSIISIFLSPIFGVLLFVVRNRPRHVQVIRQVNVYNNFNGYNNFNNQGANQNGTSTKPENPFPEFDGEDRKSNDNNDEFFN